MIILHCACKYLHDHWGYNVVPAKLAYTNGGHRFYVCSKVRATRGLKINSLMPVAVIFKGKIIIVNGALADAKGDQRS